MIYYFLISIVFLAELIIALTLVINLIKLDRKVNDINNFLDEAQPSIKKILILMRQISKQLLILAPIFVRQIKSFISDLIMGQVKSLAGGLTFWLVKKEVEKHV